MSNKDVARLAEAATRVLQDEAFTAAVQMLRKNVSDQLWSAAVNGARPESDRVRLEAMAWASVAIVDCLTILVNDGEILAAELLMAENLKQRAGIYNLRNVRHGEERQQVA